MIAQNHRFAVAEVRHEARALVEIERGAFVVVVAHAAEEHRVLSERHQPALERRDGHACRRMGVDHAIHIVTCAMNRTVNHIPRLIHAIIRGVKQHVAIKINPDQA